MCGIAGIFDLEMGKVDQPCLRAMTDFLAHRGPDGSGIYIDGPLGLGHRRLSIIDLQAGHQPMSNEDRTIWLIYNGEIYNFQQIREHLQNKGYRFRTASDTEVIIQAYEAYSIDCLNLFRGMFAFALWDAKKRQLVLARDRIGKKPLYYYFDGKKFLFASEIKAILQDQRVERELNANALVDYFTYHYVPFPESIFKNIYKLPPAHFMIVRPSPTTHRGTASKKRQTPQIGPLGEHLELQIREYWNLRFAPNYTLSEEQWIEALQAKMSESVQLRLISDVPIGAFLSGGVDSSTVVALMHSVCNQPPKTFSIGFDQEAFNETPYARLVAEKFSTDHHEFTVLPDAIEALEKLAWAFDEPFADSSAIPTYYVSKMARKSVTVVLSGDGGDEAFAGYDRYQKVLDWQKLDHIPLVWRSLVFGTMSSLLPLGLRGKGRLRNLSRSSFERYAGLRTFDFSGYLQNLLSHDLLNDVSQKPHPRENSYAFLRQYYDRHPDADSVSRLQYEDIKTYLAEDIMTKVDRASMICSLETRAPLLDHELLELAASIPPTLLIKAREKKYILKKTMENLLPHDILYRKKKGFEVPLNQWLKHDLAEYSRSLLLSTKAKQRGYFNTKYIETLLQCHQSRYRDLSPQLWALLFFERWCQNWLDV